jgi:hypothetical protein
MHSKINQSFKKGFTALTFFCLTLILTACGNSEDAQKVKAALDVNTLNITSLEVSSPRDIMEITATEPFTAMAIIANGTKAPINISNKVKWSSSDTGNATINSSGVLTGKAIETLSVTVSAQLADLTASKEIKLSNAPLERIDILTNPSPVSVCRGGYQLTAEGKYETEVGEAEDIRTITDLVTWASGDQTLLKFGETGVFSTYKDGTTTVTASLNTIDASAPITINDDIDSIAITAGSDTVNVGSTLSFTATGTYDDTSTADITKNVSWISDTPSVLSVSNDTATKGIATGVSVELANISATCLSSEAVVSNEALITVKVLPVIDGVSINEGTANLEFKIADSPEQLTAKLTKSGDASFGNVVTDNDNISWSVKRTISGTALTVSNTKGSKGEITFNAVGITEIEIRYDDKDADEGPFSDVIEVEIVAN